MNLTIFVYYPVVLSYAKLVKLIDWLNIQQSLPLTNVETCLFTDIYNQFLLFKCRSYLFKYIYLIIFILLWFIFLYYCFQFGALECRIPFMWTSRKEFANCVYASNYCLLLLTKYFGQMAMTSRYTKQECRAYTKCEN